MRFVCLNVRAFEKGPEINYQDLGLSPPEIDLSDFVWVKKYFNYTWLLNNINAISENEEGVFLEVIDPINFPETLVIYVKEDLETVLNLLK